MREKSRKGLTQRIIEKPPIVPKGRLSTVSHLDRRQGPVALQLAMDQFAALVQNCPLVPVDNGHLSRFSNRD